jgi:succinylglutamic semialdehyde dehydrogenase
MIYINGNWKDGKGKKFNSINPSDNSIIWEGNFASSSQVKDAIKSARKAFPIWSKQPLESRLKIIKKFYSLVELNKDKIQNLIRKETGKEEFDSLSEVGASLAKYTNSLNAFHERTGKSTSSLGNNIQITNHKPHGILNVIGPFNFPFHLPNGHITPALIAGNVIIFKPSEHTPMVAELMVDLWHEAGLPNGVINLLHGSKEIVQSLAKHPQTNGVLFTGSYTVGLSLNRLMSNYPHKILALELGGNNPLVVWSTRKIIKATDIAFESAFISTGQRCTCARRLILPNNKSSKKLIKILKNKSKDISFSEQSKNYFYGPLISREAVKNFLNFQDALIKAGGKVILKGRSIKSKGNFVSPAIIDMTNAKRQFDKEMFGPLIQVKYVDAFDDAIAEANDTSFGLSAGLVSDNKKLFDKFIQGVSAGVINFNTTTTGASGGAPFGGPGMSGNLRPAGFYAADYCAWPVASVINENL